MLAISQQQKLREWILSQRYFSLNPQYDGMTAWEISGKILAQLNPAEEEIKGDYCSQCQHIHFNDERLKVGLKCSKCAYGH